MTAQDLKVALEKHANADDAVFLQRFFKTGKGQYGEGDVFIGVRVPQTRAICKDFKDLPLAEIQKLFDSPVHEHRLVAVILLANKFPKATEQGRRKIYELYLKNVYKNRINNWDIVDLSADRVVGAYLENRDKKILLELAKSDNIWQKRVAMLSTFHYIKKGDPGPALDVIDIILHDPHDLIQKATGWMLREIGKKAGEEILTGFLDKHAHDMPRTTLRYAIERLTPGQKGRYMEAKLKSHQL
jgi:3-methyladenine DNA glycosylase AlkD